MKKSIKTIGTMVAVGVMLVGTFWLGSVTSNQTVDAQMKTEPKEIMPQEEACPERRIMCGNYYDYMVIETVDGNEWFLMVLVCLKKVSWYRLYLILWGLNV